MILVIARLLDPSSELHISEQWYAKTALPDLLGVPEDRVDDNRLYRALDELLPHKEALEIHLDNAFDGCHIRSIPCENLITKRHSASCDNQCDTDLFAIAALVTRVSTLGQRVV